jgi:hypothetical protein
MPSYITPMGKFYMPPWWNPDKPQNIPNVQVSDTQDAWQCYIQSIRERYGEVKELPAGTKLYHGSLQYPNIHLPKKFRYFGADAVISLWYLNEMVDNQNLDPEETTGYLYEFVLMRPLPFDFITKVEDHPATLEECQDETCVHPQVAYHYPSTADICFVDVGTEVTIPVSKLSYTTLETSTYLKPIGVYTVDINLLDTNAKKSVYIFNPVQAITARIWSAPIIPHATDIISLRSLRKKIMVNSLIDDRTKKHLYRLTQNFESTPELLEDLSDTEDGDILSILANSKVSKTFR